jgi:hypothetical protein
MPPYARAAQETGQLTTRSTAIFVACSLTALSFSIPVALGADGDFYICKTVDFDDTAPNMLPDPGFREAALAKKFSIGEIPGKIVVFTTLADMSSQADFTKLPDSQLDTIGTRTGPDLQTVAILKVPSVALGGDYPATIINVQSYAVHTWFLSCKKF